MSSIVPYASGDHTDPEGHTQVAELGDPITRRLEVHDPVTSRSQEVDVHLRRDVLASGDLVAIVEDQHLHTGAALVAKVRGRVIG